MCKVLKKFTEGNARKSTVNFAFSHFADVIKLRKNLRFHVSARRLRPCYGHVTRGNFSCNLSRNKRCEISCKTDFTCNTPVLQPATATKCCVASCKKSRNILNFSQRCETSCCLWHVHRNLQRNFGKIRQSFARRRFQAGGERVVNNFQWARCKLRKNIANV